MTDQHPPTPPGPGPGPGPEGQVPYGQPAYGYPYVAPLATAPTILAGWTIAVAVLLGLAQLGALASSWSARDEYVAAAQQGRPGWDVVTVYDLVGLLSLPVMVACYVVGCLWLHACRRNVELVRPEFPHTRRKVWVWLGWWVPFVSLWFPFQVVRDVQEAGRTHREPVGLGLWWTGWLVYVVGARIASRLIGNDTIDQGAAEALPVVEVVVTAGLLLALARWIRIVHGITAGQRELLTPQ